MHDKDHEVKVQMLISQTCVVTVGLAIEAKQQPLVNPVADEEESTCNRVECGHTGPEQNGHCRDVHHVGVALVELKDVASVDVFVVFLDELPGLLFLSSPPSVVPALEGMECRKANVNTVLHEDVLQHGQCQSRPNNSVPANAEVVEGASKDGDLNVLQLIGGSDVHVDKQYDDTLVHEGQHEVCKR